ncbi:MAG TPA: GNAT family N-acetyltransferase [Devosia sp.]|nr:GNAT family N-acetyltransferase [Devosia sp.]
MTLTYRAATAADLPFIVRLSVEGSVLATKDDVTAFDPRYAAAFAAIDNDPNHELWIVERDGVPAGSFQLSYIPGIPNLGGWRGLIENVQVDSAQRGGGIGGEMMRFAIERCRERGCWVVQLTSNKQRLDAHRFYDRLGFVATHEGYKLHL